MTEKTDTLGWEIPSEKDESEAGEWGGILNNTIENDIEPDVAEALDVSGGNAQLSEARKRYDDAKQGSLAAYQRLGTGSLTQLTHTQQIVGTRRMAAHWPLVDPHFRDDSFTYTNSGTNERVQVINYSFLEQPPNMVPVLRAQCSLISDTSGRDFSVGIRHNTQPSGEYLMTFKNQTPSNTFYDEVYLNEVGNGSAGRAPDTLVDTQLEVHADVDQNPSSGRVFGSSHLMLGWEVV